MTPWRTKTTNHNNNGRALGLNKRALDFCFNNAKHIYWGFPWYFSCFQKNRTNLELTWYWWHVCPRPSQISYRSSTWNCDFSHTFQPTPVKLLLTRSSFGAISSEMGPKGHRYPRQKCGTKMWDLPKFLKIGQWRHVSWRHCTDKTFYDPDWSIIIIYSKLNLIFFSKYGVVKSSIEVTRSM